MSRAGPGVLAAAAALAAAFVGQAMAQGPTDRSTAPGGPDGLLRRLPPSCQGPLARANRVRASKTLHAVPSSLAFRVAAGGVKEAAGDALWLTVLPRLGKPWVEKDRKAAWIESVTAVMVDTNPRSLFPPIYAAYFLEFADPRHPAIERLMLRAAEIEKRGPFGRRTRPNADAWQLPEILGMNLLQHGRTPGERERGKEHLRAAASKPDCPGIVIDYLSGLGRREGNPLEGWDLYVIQAATTRNPDWRAYYLSRADETRLAALRQWAGRAEARLGRWPGTIGEVLAEAPPAVADELRRLPDRRAALVEGVVLHPSSREVEIESVTERLLRDAKEEFALLARAFEAGQGRKPRSFRELAAASGRTFAPPPRHGTRWEWDEATGAVEVVPDFADPRLRR